MKKLIIILVFAVSFASCKKEELKPCQKVDQTTLKGKLIMNAHGT